MYLKVFLSSSRQMIVEKKVVFDGVTNAEVLLVAEELWTDGAGRPKGVGTI